MRTDQEPDDDSYPWIQAAGGPGADAVAFRSVRKLLNFNIRVVNSDSFSLFQGLFPGSFFREFQGILQGAEPFPIRSGLHIITHGSQVSGLGDYPGFLQGCSGARGGPDSVGYLKVRGGYIFCVQQFCNLRQENFCWRSYAHEGHFQRNSGSQVGIIF